MLGALEVLLNFTYPVAEPDAEAEAKLSQLRRQCRGGKPPDLLCLFSANAAQLILRATQTICVERQSDTVSKGIFGHLGCLL